ncbi:unnamed protein product [Thelazia callipaeda]|uniref:NUC domain-containing protein n=1 Tax=Thelazia callipaeda TaxID=103827 RepID=A0A0N5D970_THECL|nr:unnamed protein product [Thelazia callipaeda]
MAVIKAFANGNITYSVIDQMPAESGHRWSDEDCSIKCDNAKFNKKPLLVISLDGFKRSYLEHSTADALQNVAKCGATAEIINMKVCFDSYQNLLSYKYMYASYPSKTFPNHYAIVTGLYPESSGIVDNNIYDNQFSSELIDIRRVKDARYFKGTPIWNLLEQRNISTACLYWAGCDFLINGLKPKYNLKYNSSMSNSDRIKQIVSWLDMPSDERPQLIMAYFDQPDRTANSYTVKVYKMVKAMDLMIDDLLDEIHQINALNCVNIIILSDHVEKPNIMNNSISSDSNFALVMNLGYSGMQELRHRLYLDTMISNSNTLFANGVVGRIYFPNITDISILQKNIEETMNELKCFNKDIFHVYDKRRLPKRYHYSASNRVGDIILDGEPGAIFFRNQASDYHITRDHGYDFMVPSMRTIFYARGPNIKNLVLKPFQNIELFNLMAALLNVPHETVPSNNGTEGRLSSVLRDIDVKKATSSEAFNVCETTDNNSQQKITCFLGSLLSGNTEHCYLCKCCSSTRLPSILIKSLKNLNGTIALIEQVNGTLPSWNVPINKQSAEWMTVSLSVEGNNDVEVDLYSSFVNGYFADLQMLTYNYSKLYNEIVVMSGAIYDFNDDGVADAEQLSLLQRQRPSHIFRILFRCEDAKWLRNELQCEKSNSIRALPLILPNVGKDYNCLNSSAYLSANIARLRDIELLTGLEFFSTVLISDSQIYDEEFSITSRTIMPEHLW